MHDSVAMAWLGLGLIVVLAIGAAAILRSARCPGWAVVAGIAAGIVLGPTLLGRVLPGSYEQLYIGGRAAQQNLIAAQQFQQHAATEAGVDPLDAQSIDELREARDAARWRHQQPMRVATLIVVAVVLLGAAAGPRGSPDAAQRPVHSITIGGWAALLPGGITFVVLHLLLDVQQSIALLAAATVAIGPWQMSRGDVEAADNAELGGARLLHRSGIVAGVIGMLLAGYAAWQLRSTAGLVAALPLAVLALSWLVPHIDSRVVHGALQHVLVPVMAALAAIKVELFLDFAIWPIVLFIVLSGDGRWLGGYIGAMLLGGRAALRTMRLVIGVMACGPTQLAVAAIASQCGLLDGSLVYAVIAGAVLLEVLTPMRRSVADRIAVAEAELDELMDE